MYVRLFAAAIAVTIPSLALAQSSSIRTACATDIKTLCSSVEPGRGKMRECIRAHRAQLSDACKSALTEREMRRSGTQPGGEVERD